MIHLKVCQYVSFSICVPLIDAFIISATINAKKTCFSAVRRPIASRAMSLSTSSSGMGSGAKEATSNNNNSTMPGITPAGCENSNVGDPLVQYVVVRRDLLDIWPTGSVIAQAVHASVVAIWQTRDLSNTMSYCNQEGNGDSHSSSFDNRGVVASQMHTIVLEAKNEAALTRLADALRDADVAFAVWREQPENILTALAAQPYPRSTVKKYFSKFRLFK